MVVVVVVVVVVAAVVVVVVEVVGFGEPLLTATPPLCTRKWLYEEKMAVLGAGRAAGSIV